VKGSGHARPAPSALEDVAARRGIELLAARYKLDGRQRAQFETILLALADDERAPTAVRDPARAVDVHLADSLAALEVDAVRGSHTIADVGAGAGFPGLALAVALPEASVSLVESQARKCRFAEVVRAGAGIDNAHVVRARAEEWELGRGANDAVLARALAEPAVVLEYAAPLLRIGGSLVEWRGRREAAEERRAAAAAEVLDMELVEVRRVEPYAGAHDRHLHVYAKTNSTPDGFPRRAGMARKRPLGRGV
jgi:16S rRNA (guanine527-N7)-methyltransferase